MEESTYNAIDKREVKTLDIFPLGRGKRVLSYLADFFLTLILSLTLFHLAIYPLGRLIVGYDSWMKEFDEASLKRDSVLYGNELLFAKKNQEPNSLGENLEETCLKYTSYFVDGGEEKYEVFKTYYVKLGGGRESYPKIYEAAYPQEFFVVNDGAVSLKETYIEEFKPLFDYKDTISSQGERDYKNFQKHVFLNLYDDMLASIKKNDLSYNGISYKAEQSRVDKIIRQDDALLIFSSFIAYFTSIVLLFIAIPMASRSSKTLGMIFLRNNRIESDSLKIIGKGRAAMLSIFYFALNAWMLFFLPFPQLDINTLFSVPILLSVSGISLILVIASLLTLLFDRYNRSLTDIFSRSVLVNEKTLDEIYRAKGYKI